MHAPRVLESFHIVLESFQKLHRSWKVATWCFGKFSKATPVLESCYVVFWKVFKSSMPHVSTLVLFSFLEDGRCIPPVLVDYKSAFWIFGQWERNTLYGADEILILCDLWSMGRETRL
jgi:hypothetical protein